MAVVEAGTWRGCPVPWLKVCSSAVMARQVCLWEQREEPWREPLLPLAVPILGHREDVISPGGQTSPGALGFLGCRVGQMPAIKSPVGTAMPQGHCQCLGEVPGALTSASRVGGPQVRIVVMTS